MSQDPRCQLDFAQIFIRISSTLPTCPRPFIPWPRSKCALMRDNQRNTLHTPVCGYKSHPIIWICPSSSLKKPKTPKCVFDLLICQMAVSIVDQTCQLMLPLNLGFSLLISVCCILFVFVCLWFHIFGIYFLLRLVFCRCCGSHFYMGLCPVSSPC